MGTVQVQVQLAPGSQVIPAEVNFLELQDRGASDPPLAWRVLGEADLTASPQAQRAGSPSAVTPPSVVTPPLFGAAVR